MNKIKNGRYVFSLSIGLMITILGVLFQQSGINELVGISNIFLALGLNYMTAVTFLRYEIYIEEKRDLLRTITIVLIVIVAIIWFTYEVFFNSTKFDIYGSILISILINLLFMTLVTDRLRSELKIVK